MLDDHSTWNKQETTGSCREHNQNTQTAFFTAVVTEVGNEDENEKQACWMRIRIGVSSAWLYSGGMTRCESWRGKVGVWINFNEIRKTLQWSHYYYIIEVVLIGIGSRGEQTSEFPIKRIISIINSKSPEENVQKIKKCVWQNN